MLKNFYIGCSGYYYPTWKNDFYPAGVQSRNWLTHYSSVFNTVELNGTFYRTPKLSDLERHAAATPADFRFSVKMSKFITHISRLKGTKDDIVRFQDLMRDGLKEKTLHYLFQLPPSFRFSEENLGHILENIPHHPENVVELRHVSWWNDTVQQAFATAGLTFCNVDFPGLETYFMQTSDCFYLRLHGNPELFKSSYSQEELQAFYRQFPTEVEQYSVYFNNTYYDAGYKNASLLKEIITR